MSRYATYNKGGESRPLMRFVEAEIILRNVRDTRFMNSTDEKEYLKKVKPRIMRMIADGKPWEEIDAYFLLRPGRAKEYMTAKKKRSNHARKREIERAYPKIRELLANGASRNSVCKRLNIPNSTLLRHLPYIFATEARP